MGKYHHDFDKKKIVRRSEEELVRIPAPELAYVSEEVFDKVQERLRAKTGNGRGVNAYSDPLSGKSTVDPVVESSGNTLVTDMLIGCVPHRWLKGM